MRALLLWLWLLSQILPASAQQADSPPQPSFACSKARTLVEQTICRNPALAERDDHLYRAFTNALAQNPKQQEQLRHEQQQWLAERDKRCAALLKAKQEQPAVTCLLELYDNRITTLTGSITVPLTPPVISAPELPAQGTQAAYLDITTAGRYAITTHSQTGVALTLIDYMNGPIGNSGAPGQADGRIDQFLDQGRYKLITHGASKAQGAVTLAAQPFVELQPTPVRLPVLEPIASELDDHQQRSYWLEVKERDWVFLEAGGRFLDSVHLWRDGLTLLDLPTERRTLEPRTGRPLTVLTLDTVLDPGFYRVTFYGGPAQTPWTEQSADKPLYVRLGIPRIETATRQWRTLGPLGIDRFLVASTTATYGRLELPAAAPLQGEVAEIERSGRKLPARSAFSFTAKTRLPVWETDFNASADIPGRIITVQGRQGQGYVWQNFERLATESLTSEGEYWFTLISAGDERDNPPLTTVLAWPQNPSDPNRPDWRILASNAPRFGKAAYWQGRFNVLGPTELFIEIAAAGEYTIQTQGIPLLATLKPLLVTDNRAVKPRSGPRWSLETGFYRLELTPEQGQRGIVDVLFQSADRPANGGNTVTIAPPRFHSLKIPRLTRLFINQRPQVAVGLLQRSVPITLREPLMVPLAPAESVELTVTIPGKGRLEARDEQGRSQPVVVDATPQATQDSIAAGTHKVRLLAPQETGIALSLQWQPDPSPPAPLPAGLGQVSQQPLPGLSENTPLALEFTAELDQPLAIDVHDPGLFRLETTGRLWTQGRLRTSFLPQIAEAEANGVGHNFLIQSYLRAGHYILNARSRRETSGHAQALYRRAPLRDGGLLSFTVPTRIQLAGGEGVVYRFTVPASGGTHQLQVLSLGQTHGLRLEDAEGWPILPPGQSGTMTAELQPGAYRLVVLPADVAGQVLVNWVAPAEPVVTLQGHGPHPLPLNNPQTFRWLEPATEGAERTPDQWTFTLVGETDVRVEISEGMRGELQRLDSPEHWQSEARLSGQKAYEGRVPAGHYRLLTEALGRNNQLDYTVTAWTKQLVPDQARRFTDLPVKIPLAVARDQVVELASSGRRDVRATLRDAAGHVITRSDDRSDGWDFLIARQLQAGHYELTVEAVTVADSTAEDSQPAGDEETSTEATAGETSEPVVRDGNRNGWIDEQEVWVTLHLPTEVTAPALPSNGDVELADGAVRVFPLSATGTEGCALFAARSAGELTLALEEQEPGGGWRVLDTASGRSPWLAMQAAQPVRRLRVWGSDGGKAPIKLFSRWLNAKPQPLTKTVAWEPIAGIEPLLGMALVELPAVQAVRLPLADPTVRSAVQVGDVFQPAAGDILVPQTRRLWLLKPIVAGETLALAPVIPTVAEPIKLTVPAGRSVRLPATSPGTSELTFWRAESRLGQPGLDAGSGMGVATDSAVATGQAAELRIWHAGSREAALPVILQRYNLRTTAAETSNLGMGNTRLAMLETRLLRLPAGHKHLRLELPARLAAVLDWGKAAPQTLWTGDHTQSYDLDTAAETILLANLGSESTPIAWSLAPVSADAALRLSAGVLFRRFEPSAGVILLPVEGRPGLELIAQGQEVTTTVVQADGSVQRGGRLPLNGPAQVLLHHGPGLLAAWLSGDTADPWPRVQAQPVQIPSILPLHGPALALQVEFDHPVMLYGRGSAPLLAGVRRDGRQAIPALYPQGAQFAHYLPPGRSELLLLPPQEGDLAGVLELQASAVYPLAEGMGQAYMVAPGGAQLFGFRVTQPGPVGIGVQAVPDVVIGRLLNEQGQVTATGVVQMPRLAAGYYVFEVTVPPTESPVQIRPALVGITPPPAGPPPEVRQQFRDWLNASRQKRP